MARKPRVEYEGAVYHVMCRGDRQNDIFRDDKDRETFIDTLSEACERQGWRIHAYVLMNNHYHFLLETPRPNLVVGMKWFQGTYTQRFNARHREWGHLFQGRYKAIVIQSDGGDYFSTVATYIHLNPVRAKLLNFKTCDLAEYRWSSYPLYFDVSKRPDWLVTDRVLGIYDLKNDASGLEGYRQFIQRRTAEIYSAENPHEFDAAWKDIRRGWCVGDLAFKDQMKELVNKRIGTYDRRSYLGAEARTHDESEAERLLTYGLDCVELSEKDLVDLKKSDVRKKLVAWLIRKNTSVSNDWVCNHLHMGRASNLSRYVREIEISTDEIIERLKEMMKKAF